MSDVLVRQFKALAGGTAVLVVVAVMGGVYSATGGSARARQVALLCVYIVLVVGVQMFVGNSGVFSLGHMATAGVAGYTAAILAALPTVKQTTIPDAPFGLANVQLHPLAAAAAALVVALVFAAVTGVAISRVGGLAALIVTLALLVIVNTGLTNWVALTGGAEAFYGYPPMRGFGWPLGVAFIAVGVALLYKESREGVRLQATREDELAAGAAGIDVVRARYVGWCLSSVVAGAGGILMAYFVGAINPDQYFIHLTLVTLAMLVLGGMRSVAGAVIGAVVILAGTELTRYLGDGPVLMGFDLPQLFGLSTLFLGATILVVMLVRPEGLLSDWEPHHWLHRRHRDEAGPARTLTSTVESHAPGHALEVENVSQRFAGLTALDGVSLNVQPGEVVGLIGPNGAGKTTLINIMSSIVEPTAGRVALGGTDITAAGSVAAARRGVARTFQNIRLFADLTVRENIEAALSTVERRSSQNSGMVERLLVEFELEDYEWQKAATLPYGQQRQLEMARAMALRPSILLLDEPAAGMGREETDALLTRVRRVASDAGCGVVVVDHDLQFILGLCDRIYVLSSGKRIAEGTPEQIQADPAVVAAYVGSPDLPASDLGTEDGDSTTRPQPTAHTGRSSE